MENIIYIWDTFSRPRDEINVIFILPEVKPLIEVTEEELKEREAREKEYIKRLEELREEILENMAKIAEVAREEEASSRKVYKMLEAYLPTEFKERINQYKGEEKLELGIRDNEKGKLTNITRAYVRL